MKNMESFFNIAADKLWGDWLLFLLLGLGIFYTIITEFVQIKHFPYVCKNFILQFKIQNKKKRKEGTYSSYQTLCTALGSCVGSGNIVGVSMAILSGGPGALFWMWIAAFFGMATKYAEIILGMCYHGHDVKGRIIGGPMYYIVHGLKWKRVGAFAAVFLFIQNAGATLIQSNTLSTVVLEAFHIPQIVTGIVLAVIMTFVIGGGIKRIVQVAEKAVPLMAGIYILGGIIVIGLNLHKMPEMLRDIIEGAFSFRAGMGAVAGVTIKEAMRYGVARGLYSNEAGEGSAAVFHSAAQVDHPVRQGLFGIIEVFIDTIVICSTTGFAILITGVNANCSNAATLASAAFGTVAPAFSYVVSISLILFAGTSIMSQWYFGHVSLNYLKIPKGDTVYRILFPMAIVFGSLSTVDLVWSIQDCALALLIIPNILALICLSPKVRKLTKEFFNPANGFIKGGKGDSLL